MRVLRPENLNDAIKMQQENCGYYIAGGTSSMVDIYNDKFSPECLIDLSLLKELYGIEEFESHVKLGALATFTEIEKNEIILKYFPALAKAASEVGGPQVRNRGTVAGNICAASPAADSATPLLALGALINVTGLNGERVIPVEEFFVAPRKTVLTPDEIVTSITLPKTTGTSLFYKVGKRNALAVSSINMAVSANFAEKKLCDVKIAVGSAAPTPRLCKKTSELLNNEGLAVLEKAKELLLTEISPIDDRWATAEYRREVAKNMLEHLVTSLTEGK